MNDDEFHIVTVDRNGQTIRIDATFITAFGEVRISRVKRYFRDDEWFYVKMAARLADTMKGYTYLTVEREPRECPIRRAWCRALNIADVLAEGDWSGVPETDWLRETP